MKSTILPLLIGLGALAQTVRAHLVMEFPIPMASKYDKTYTGSDIDYNYMANLLNDGSNFPCRGNHLKTGTGVVATLKVGQSYDFK